MMRQPPESVPAAIVRAHIITTTTGTWKSEAADPLSTPPLIRAMVIIPIVFCASFVPWAIETRAEEKSCICRLFLLT